MIQGSLKTNKIKTKNLLTIILFHFLVLKHLEDEEQRNEETLSS